VSVPGAAPCVPGVAGLLVPRAVLGARPPGPRRWPPGRGFSGL